MTTTEFAKKMNISYDRALIWLRTNQVPGAVRKDISPGLSIWEIPESALTSMDRPKQGRPIGSKARKSYA